MCGMHISFWFDGKIFGLLICSNDSEEGTRKKIATAVYEHNVNILLIFRNREEKMTPICYN